VGRGRRPIAALLAVGVVAAPAGAGAQSSPGQSIAAGRPAAPQTESLRFSLPPPHPVVNQSWTLFINVRNTGSIAFAPHGLLSLYPAGGGAALQQQLLTYPTVLPGASFNGRVELRPLRSGAYDLDVTLFAPGGRAHSRVRFGTRAHQPLGTWIVDHLPFLLAGLAGLVAFLLARRAMPRTRDEDPASAADAATPADASQPAKPRD
jgi:hypothetical protein